ncbi:MAG: dihydrodipicolinate synthase family protein [Anaerolineae bacterium]|nr:dihydrodipicolinate synthase family protein [Anaerolineae bacterium]
MAQPALHGLWPVMLTSFREDGAIDWQGIDALIEWYIASGASGLFACCLSSEMYALSPEERLALTRRVVARCAGRVPVVATGTFGGPVAQQAAFVRQMADTGVDAVVVITSQLAAADEDEAVLRGRMERLLEGTAPAPLGLYECPVPYKRVLVPETVSWLARTGRFGYLKDTTCDLGAIQGKLAAARGTPLRVFNAHTPTALASLRSGAAGLSPIAANYYPGLYAWLCAHHADRPAEALAVQRSLTLMEGVARTYYPTAAKAFLRERGLPIGTRCRTQYLSLSADDHVLLASLAEEADRLLRAYGAAE